MKKWVIFRVKNLDQEKWYEEHGGKMEEITDETNIDFPMPIVCYFHSKRKAQKSIKGFKAEISKETHYLHRIAPQGNCVAIKREFLETR
jgi:hypothetical protein